jgi:hypothetical protein
MVNTRKDTTHDTVLNTAFDVSYMALLETDQVSLDDELQSRLRVMIVDEVRGVLLKECERMGKTGADAEQYVCTQAYREVSRRLRQELQQEEMAGSLPSPLAARMVLLPAFETVEG